MPENYIPVSKIVDENGNEIEFGVYGYDSDESYVHSACQDDIDELDKYIKQVEDKAEDINRRIDNLTNHADKLDYAVAVVSGLITGMMDVFLVGETDIDKDKIQNMLEKNYHTSHDKAYMHKKKNGQSIDSPMYHRLDDLAHHPSLLGLVASMLNQYLRLVVFVDGADGKPHAFFADKPANASFLKQEKKDIIIAWSLAVLSGLFIWLGKVSEKKYEDKYDEKMPEPLRKLVKFISNTPLAITILRAADIWVGHMMSDVSTPMGIPGIFLSFLKEVSTLDVFKMTNLPVVVDRMYRLGNDNLSEWGGVVYSAAKKQVVPVLINELLVRGFYFARNLCVQLKENKGRNLNKIDWEKILPMKNRTIERMLTISTGTFMAVDLCGAALNACKDAATASAGGPATSLAVFIKSFVLGVNFVGIGRFAIAVVTDVKMGIDKKRLESERIEIYNELLSLTNAKLFYKNVEMLMDTEHMLKVENEMWCQAKDAAEAYVEALKAMVYSVNYFSEAWDSIIEDTFKMSCYIDGIEEFNPGLMNELFGSERRLLEDGINEED